MSLIDNLIDENKWLEFLNYKENKNLKKKEFNKLKEFILNKEYFFICEKIVNNNYTFSIPKKVFVNKRGSSKKRIVYRFSYEENIILKMVNYLMYEYDYLLCKNLYSFRKNINQKDGFNKLKKFRGYSYKVDISNYFNSINVNRLLSDLEGILDEKTYSFFYGILSKREVMCKGEIICEDKGVLAGCAISAFLSNFYLRNLDYMFKDKMYIRYADDIIIFNEDKSLLDKDIDVIKNYLNDFDLKINTDKEIYFDKNSEVTFLGFSHNNGVFDISNHGVKKLKSKIRRKSRALRRWMLRKDISPLKAMKAMNNIFNYKFYYERDGKYFNWVLWYFPVINTSKSLKEIDSYYQECLRYIYTGNHNKSSKWKVKYETLKETGYRSLVNEFYKYKKENK